MKTIYPGMRAPSFCCTERPEDGATILHYYSEWEGLEPIVIGIVKAVAKHLHKSEVRNSHNIRENVATYTTKTKKKLDLATRCSFKKMFFHMCTLNPGLIKVDFFQRGPKWNAGGFGHIQVKFVQVKLTVEIKFANAKTMCCFPMLTCWIQLPGHLYVPCLVRSSPFSYRNETLTALAQVNIVKHFRYDHKSVERRYIN